MAGTMVRWLVIQMKGRKLWPGNAPTKIEGFSNLHQAELLAEKLSHSDHEEYDYVVIWDIAVNKVTWGPR